MTPVKCALGMDWLTNAVKEDSLSTMTCADGIVICRENRGSAGEPGEVDVCI